MRFSKLMAYLIFVSLFNVYLLVSFPIKKCSALLAGAFCAWRRLSPYTAAAAAAQVLDAPGAGVAEGIAYGEDAVLAVGENAGNEEREEGEEGGGAGEQAALINVSLD